MDFEDTTFRNLSLYSFKCIAIGCKRFSIRILNILEAGKKMNSLGSDMRNFSDGKFR